MASLLCLPLVVQRKIFEKLDFQTRLGVEIHWFQNWLSAVVHGPLGSHWKIQSGSELETENPKAWTRMSAELCPGPVVWTGILTGP